MNIQNCRETLPIMKQCAVEAGLYPYWFLAFGTLLGCVRPSPRMQNGQLPCVQGFMEHDDDMDVGILRDNISADQEDDYVDRLRQHNMFREREVCERRSDNNRRLWFTLRRDKPPVGTKCCHWLFYEWKGFMWHSKGRDWLNERKFPSSKYPHTYEDEAIGKGLPAQHLDELMEVEFEGGRYNIPVRFGHTLDAWYPRWAVPRKGGASATEYIMKVGRWSDEATWKIY